ncbi:MAG: hypothetical protein OHK0021_05120 [Bryobacter sp.]
MIRLGTYNLENLFDRPKIINLEDNQESSRLLKLADQLQKEIGKTTYDKAKIEQLLVDLKGYVTVRSDKGKFFVGQSKTKVKATGRAEWEGGIEFVRVKFDDKQRENTARLVKSLKADVLCMIEVEGRQTLTDFMREFFPTSARLGYNMLIDSPIDPRGIDIAIAWRKASLGILRSNAYDRTMINGREASVWSRDCLELELKLKDGKSLWLLGNHFKSKFGGDTPKSIAKRTAQSQRVVEILNERYNLKQDYVAVLGDLNDTPDSAPMAPLYAAADLHDVFEVVNTPAADRYTYYYGGNPLSKRKTQIDYIFVSEALRPLVKDVSVHRGGMTAVAQGKIPEIQPMEGVTGWRDAASDHAAITVDIDTLEMSA